MKRLADRFLEWYCHPDFVDDIQGDLEEFYHLNSLRYSTTLADLKYAMDVLLLFRPSLMRAFGQNSIYTGMIKNYFKISVRNILTHKVYSAINIFGLSIGLGAFFLISLYTGFEKSYDRYFSQSENLYRLTTDLVIDGEIKTRDAMSFSPSGKALKEDLPEVLDYTTTYKFTEITFRKGDGVKLEKNIVAADSNFFKLFDYEMVAGNPLTALEKPNSLVLTESKARSYFGNTNPIGQSLQLLSGLDRSFEVTGVIRDVPENTHYKFDILMSISTIQERLTREAWNGFNYYTYLLMGSETDISTVEEKLPELANKYLGEDNSLTFNLQPVEAIHLTSNFTYEPEIHGSDKAVQFLGIIALFVLIIAWVNYINLSTARAVDRAKEVGLRKVIGAQRSQLIGQFLFESFLINGLGLLAAIGLAELLLPNFNYLVGKPLAQHIWEGESFFLSAAFFLVLGTFVTGVYPALVLSGFVPVTVLKGKFRNSKSGVLLRKGLVVTQFAISMIMIAGTFIVMKQVDYMLTRDKGFDIRHAVGITTPRAGNGQEEQREEQFKAFQEELRKFQAISNVGATSSMPGGGSSDIASSAGEIEIIGLTEQMNVTTYIQLVNDDFFPTMDMKVLHGRNFNEDFAQDTIAVLVNESFIKRFGIADQSSVIGQRLQLGNNPDNPKYNIVGVLKDFNRTSLKLKVEPTVYLLRPSLRTLVVKLDGASFQEGMTNIEEKWAEFYPNAPLDIRFLDERFERLYEEDRRFGSVFGAFSGLAIFIAILGLFGLASFMALQKTKEMGIRKVLGAPISNIVMIFFKDFATLIGIAAVLGIPTIYFVMNQWLDNYAYRIDFPWWITMTTLLIILFFAFLTVGYQIYKVAVLNPSKIIRYE